MAAYADIALLIVAIPFCLWATWSDLRYMTIPNMLVLSMAGVFLVVGAIVLPFTDVFLWRVLGGVIVLTVGFLLFAIGGLGGGDAKFAAAMVLFVDHADILDFILILALVTLVAVTLHIIIGKLKFAAPLTQNWKSWEKQEKRKFPLGFGMGSALILYLALRLFAV